jgi:hypothetical protein
MAYEPKTPAAKDLHTIMTALSGAQHDWETYAMKLGRAYGNAFDKHEEGLKNVAEKYRLGAESAYWVLALLCVAVTGGVVGGMLAPWVAGAGTTAATMFKRTLVSEASQAITAGVVGQAMQQSPNNEPFKPQAKRPDRYRDDMLIELGECYFQLRQELDKMMQAVDGATEAQQKAVGKDVASKKNTILSSILATSPKNLPDEAKAERIAEIGMWLSWASVREHDYWKTRYEKLDKLDRGPVSRSPHPYLIEVDKLRPIMPRLEALGLTYAIRTIKIGAFNNSHQFYQYDWKIVDLNKLKLAGTTVKVADGLSVFVNKVAEVIKAPFTVLPELQVLPPLWARNGGQP